jgi:glycosyltransferase involved in cell wall biosynthesis
MRVLQLHTRYRQPGGEDMVVQTEAGLLRAAGHEVETLQVDNPASAAAAAGALARAPWNHAAVRVVEQVVAEHRPDVVHVHNTWFAMSPAVVRAASTGAPAVVMSLHNYRITCANSMLFRDGRPCQDCVGSHPWHGVRHACYQDSRALSAVAAATIAVHRRARTWTEHVDLFLTLTPFGRQTFEAAGLPAERLCVVPHTVSDPGPRLQPPSASKDVVVVGRLSPEKGTRVVIEAMERLRGTSLRLIVIGDGPERADLEKAAGPRVSFTGHLPGAEVRQRLLGARCLLFPSLWFETYGLALVEAMAAGLPVVASDLGGSSWVAGPAGKMAPPGDVPAWTRALAALEDDGEVDRRGAAGRLRWSDRFCPAGGLAALERAYATAAARRAPAS